MNRKSFFSTSTDFFEIKNGGFKWINPELSRLPFPYNECIVVRLSFTKALLRPYSLILKLYEEVMCFVRTNGLCYGVFISWSRETNSIFIIFYSPIDFNSWGNLIVSRLKNLCPNSVSVFVCSSYTDAAAFRSILVWLVCSMDEWCLGSILSESAQSVVNNNNSYVVCSSSTEGSFGDNENSVLNEQVFFSLCRFCVQFNHRFSLRYVVGGFGYPCVLFSSDFNYINYSFLYNSGFVSVISKINVQYGLSIEVYESGSLPNQSMVDSLFARSVFIYYNNVVSG